MAIVVEAVLGALGVGSEAIAAVVAALSAAMAIHYAWGLIRRALGH